MNKYLKTSAKMAIGMGLFLPIAETIRRINQILNFSEFLSWFDDYILGGILLWAAFMVFKDKKNSVAYLIAAWGTVFGALLLSFLGQLMFYQLDSEDPGIFSTNFVTIIKGLIIMYILVGLKKAIHANLLND